MADLLEHVGQSIRSRKLLRQGERVLVAVSGGVDSMVLLRVLRSLSFTQITVAHVNHQLRGRSSDADERLVQKTAVTLDLPFVGGRADVKRQAKKNGLSLEMAGRALRHEFLARTARKRRIRTVVLAHHADDQVELFFLRVLRGAGGEGLSGMKWAAPSPADAGVRLVRPLLDVSKAELLRFACEHRIRFREDASNRALDFLRNRIRHELLPLLRRKFQPAIDRTILRSMEILGTEAEAVALAADEWRARRRSSFERLPIAVQRRIIQQQMIGRSIPADFEAIEALRQYPNQFVSVSPLVSVGRDASGLLHTRTHFPIAFNSNRLALQLGGKSGEVEFAGAQLRWRFDAGRTGALANRKPQREFFDADRVGSGIVLRHWQPGDRFQPIGAQGSLKLQDWFMNLRIPRARRHELIVAQSAAGEIFWIEGQRISERFKLTPQTKRRLVWEWKRSQSLHPSRRPSRP